MVVVAVAVAVALVGEWNLHRSWRQGHWTLLDVHRGLYLSLVFEVHEEVGSLILEDCWLFLE